MEVFSKRGRLVAQSEEPRREDAKRARLCDADTTPTTTPSPILITNHQGSPNTMEAVTQLSQSMDSVNTATGEEEVSLRQAFFLSVIYVLSMWYFVVRARCVT